jgi:hypothetical protein
VALTPYSKLAANRLTAKARARPIRHANPRQRQPLPRHQPQDAAGPRAECHEDADLSRAPRDRVAHYAIQPNRGQREAHRAEHSQQNDADRLMTLIAKLISGENRPPGRYRVNLGEQCFASGKCVSDSWYIFSHGPS